MDAFAVERYRYLLAVVAAGLLLAVIVALVLSRRPAPAELPDAEAPPRGALLPFLMLMSVALTIVTGLVLLLPVALIARFFPGWQVSLLVVLALALLTAPAVYAWRSRPF